MLRDSNRDVTKEHLSQLKYLEAVLKESMRLCPVVPMTGRIITEDMQLSMYYLFIIKINLIHYI